MCIEKPSTLKIIVKAFEAVKPILANPFLLSRQNTYRDALEKWQSIGL